MKEQLTAQFEAIPAAKMHGKVRDTVIGAVAFGVGAVGVKWLDFPWYVAAGLMGFGGFAASKELVFGFIAAFAKFIRALGGRNGAN